MKARFDFKSGQLLKSDEEYFRDLLAQKQPYNEPLEEFGGNFNTVWYISNCNHSSHAVRRWEFGKTLIDAGLKVHGEGILINIWDFEIRPFETSDSNFRDLLEELFLMVN